MPKIGLTDQQQAWLMFFALLLATVLPAWTTWFNVGMPTDRAAIGLLVADTLSGLMSGIIVYIKEAFGITITTQTKTS